MMKKIKKFSVLAVLFALSTIPTVGFGSCQTFGGGNQATVIVCDGFTFVYSGFVDFGACEGPAAGCHGKYPNQ